MLEINYVAYKLKNARSNLVCRLPGEENAKAAGDGMIPLVVKVPEDKEALKKLKRMKPEWKKVRRSTETRPLVACLTYLASLRYAAEEGRGVRSDARIATATIAENFYRLCMVCAIGV